MVSTMPAMIFRSHPRSGRAQRGFALMEAQGDPVDLLPRLLLLMLHDSCPPCSHCDLQLEITIILLLLRCIFFFLPT